MHPKMQWLSAGTDGTIWATGKDNGTVYRLFGDAGHVGWVANKVGKASVIAAVEWSTAWCINAANEIWQVSDWNTLDEPGTWRKIATHSGAADAHHIALADDGTVWYSDTEGTLYRRDGDQWVKPEMGQATRFSVDNNEFVVGYNDHGSAFIVGKPDEFNSPFGTVPIRSITARQNVLMAVGHDGCVYGPVVGDFILWKQNGWDPAMMGSAKMIDWFRFGKEGGPDAGTVRYCLTTDGDVWRAHEGFGGPGSSDNVQGMGLLWQPLGTLPSSVEEFDAGYENLENAISENLAGGHHTPQLDAMRLYCQDMVNQLHAYLLAGVYIAPPEVKAQIAFAIKSWKRYEEDFGHASDDALGVLWNSSIGGGLHHRFTMLEAEKLRGHYRHLRTFIQIHSGVSILNYLPRGD